MKKRPVRLTAARPDVDEAQGYLPRIPWRFVALGVASLATVIGGYTWKEARKAENLRHAIVRVHEGELAEARAAYTSLRDKIEGLVLGAAKAAPDTLIDPHLHIPGLRSGNGLYLRLSLDETKDKAGIAKGAKFMEPDFIAACMGLSPTSARGLYQKGEFLTPAWIKEVRKHDDVLRLRVDDEMLSRHIRADLPSVLGLMRSDWLMLVLQEGKNRRDDPVRVFLWGLRDSKLLMRARVQSIGTLISARVLSKDAPHTPKMSEEARSRSGASDCSIASQLKALAGSPAANVPALAAPTPAAPVTPSAAPADTATAKPQAQPPSAP